MLGMSSGLLLCDLWSLNSVWHLHTWKILDRFINVVLKLSRWDISGLSWIDDVRELPIGLLLCLFWPLNSDGCMHHWKILNFLVKCVHQLSFRPILDQRWLVSLRKLCHWHLSSYDRSVDLDKLHWLLSWVLPVHQRANLVLRLPCELLLSRRSIIIYLMPCGSVLGLLFIVLFKQLN